MLPISHTSSEHVLGKLISYPPATPCICKVMTRWIPLLLSRLQIGPCMARFLRALGLISVSWIDFWLALPVGNEGPSTFTYWYIGDETEPSVPTFWTVRFWWVEKLDGKWSLSNLKVIFWGVKIIQHHTALCPLQLKQRTKLRTPSLVS